ncbi:MAG: hypothetical protein CL711_02490 [Chloroflexi bacterium]|jgi:uncharacterized membrane protein|nr:MAG: hypothetical protein EGP09_00870 [SAR202 cluster bacterium]KAA1298677.1 MAG: hypothetical protein EGP06_03865 [SAR202 cluster bacterium]MAX12314.1 hypothetical protein [Chloroflexota bacterium]|tara:strand:- start:89 stop:931 length:843 start_codon:yes stop_codon:yes gene_type:complete
MSIFIITIVLISTFIHALWNFLIKKSNYPYEYIQLLAIFSGLIAVPFSIYFIFVEDLTYTGILLSFLSGFIHIFYFYFLGKAYQTGQLSYVYPISRGTSVALVPIIGTLLLNDQIGIYSIFGILIVFFGIFFLSVNDLLAINKKNIKNVLIPLLIGITITIYTIVDSIAVTLINPIIMFSISSFFGGIFSIILFDRRINHFGVIIKKNILFILVISSMSAIGYPMILYAYKYSLVSLVAPLREVSTVYAAILGIFFLNETYSKTKILGISLIVIGAILIT